MSSRRSRSGGMCDGDHVQPVVQVLLELAARDHLPEIAVGRGDHAHVDLLAALGAERLELPLLQHAQQLRLQGRRHRADLVEEDRPAVGERELALLAVERAGECAPHVAEQLRLQERFGDGRAVHLDQRHLALRAVEMNRPRDHLLAGARFAGDQHRALRLGDHLRGLDDVLDPPAAADDSVLVEFLVALAEQVSVLRPQPLMVDRAVDDHEQLVDLERLLQVVERAELHRLDRALDRRVRGHQQDLRTVGVRSRGNELADRDPGPSARASGCRPAARRTSSWRADAARRAGCRWRRPRGRLRAARRRAPVGSSPRRRRAGWNRWF